MNWSATKLVNILLYVHFDMIVIQQFRLERIYVN